MKKLLNRKYIILVLSIAFVLFITHGLFANYTENQIKALGYDKEEAAKIVETHGTFNAYGIVKQELETKISDKEEIFTNEIGDLLDSLNKDELTLVEYNELLSSKIDERRAYYGKEIESLTSKLSSLNIKEEDNLDYTDYTLADEYTSKLGLVKKYESMYDEKIKTLKKSLTDYGVRQSEIDALISEDVLTTIKALEKKVNYMKSYTALVSTSGNKYAPGSMDLFKRISDHRVANGLPPFRYNAEGQSCVDVEANSYANNKNPHNWLCKSLTSEGASLASSKSDYIKIAGDFLTSHGSHERNVLTPKYVSAACSAVERDGMVYMICGYFKY